VTAVDVRLQMLVDGAVAMGLISGEQDGLPLHVLQNLIKQPPFHPLWEETGFEPRNSDVPGQGCPRNKENGRCPLFLIWQKTTTLVQEDQLPVANNKVGVTVGHVLFNSPIGKRTRREITCENRVHILSSKRNISTVSAGQMSDPSEPCKDRPTA